MTGMQGMRFSSDDQEDHREEAKAGTFTVEHEKWTAYVCHDAMQGKIVFEVQENQPEDDKSIFGLQVDDQNMQIELDFYSNTSTLFLFLAGNPKSKISYNQLGKHLLIMDYIGGKLTSIRLQLAKLLLTASESKDRTIRTKQHENIKLRNEVARLKKDLDSSKQKQGVAVRDNRELRKENRGLMAIIRRQEHLLDLGRAEKEGLKKKFRVIVGDREQDQFLLEKMIKVRRINSGEVVRMGVKEEKVEKEQKKEKEEKEEMEEKEDKEDNELVVDDISEEREEKEQNEGNDSPDAEQMDEANPVLGINTVEQMESCQLVFQQRIKYTVPRQRNTPNFAFSLPSIKKLSPSTQSHMLYLLSDQIVQGPMRKSSKLFISFKNMSLQDELSESQFKMLSIKVGIILSSAINSPNVAAVKSAVYLSLGERGVAFGFGDVITMRLDLDELKIEWLVNSQLIQRLGIENDMLEEGIQLFMELGSQNSIIEIL